jgi:hypothetical protein
MERFAEFRRIVLSAEFRQRVQSEENYRSSRERTPPVRDWPAANQAGLPNILLHFFEFPEKYVKISKMF